jgi:clan AA aspartic protease
MIAGTVNADLEPLVRLKVQGRGGQEQEIEAVVDTGFNGFLTLPSALVAGLALPRLGLGRAVLADGRQELFNIHEATVIWDGKPRVVEADATDAEVLIGTAMLEGYDLRIRVTSGGYVAIEPFP